MKTKKHSPAVYRLYDYLKENHLGAKNGIVRKDLVEILNIPTRRLRELTAEINSSDSLEKIVSTKGSCYLCDTKEECEATIRNTYNVAISLFKKAKKMEKKVGLNGQMKIRLGKYYKEFVETFSKEE